MVSDLKTAEPLWFGRERKKETLDGFFEKQPSPFQRVAIQAACVDMWAPFRQSIKQWLPNCRIIYDKLHIMNQPGALVDDVRRAKFFRKGGPGTSEGQALAAVDALGASEHVEEAATQHPVRA
jgi:transposase